MLIDGVQHSADAILREANALLAVVVWRQLELTLDDN
jgi:hypothetical protein